MTNEQLALFIQQGNADELIPVLWERSRKIVFNWANVLYDKSRSDFQKHGIALDDFVQECYPAFLQAIKSYTADSGYKFNTFLRFPIMKIREHLLYRRRIPDPLDISVSLNISASEDESNGVELLDFVEDEDLTPDKKAEKRLVRKIINTTLERLNEKETLVIRAYFYNNETLADIAKRLNISRQRAAQIKNNALKKLRNDPDIINLHELLYK